MMIGNEVIVIADSNHYKHTIAEYLRTLAARIFNGRCNLR